MNQKSDLRHASRVEVAFSNAGFPAEYAVVIEILEARERKAHHGAREDKEEDKVVALGEADGVVHLAGRCHKGIGWGPGWLHHF